MSSRINLGSRTIDNSSPVFVIAEAGTAHLGDLERAGKLIDAAAAAGADCIKFQWVIADEIVHPKAGSIMLHGRSVPIWERFKSLERPAEFYASLKKETEKKGLIFLCSPFGQESAAGLRRLGVEAIKIASPELNHFPLLEVVSDLPLLLSTGVSKLADIERSLEFIESRTISNSKNKAGHESGNNRNLQAALLHCVTAYPAPADQYNLHLISSLASLFGTVVGVSDHSRHPYLVPTLAVSRGARIVEKHITLAHRGDGLDDPIALEPEEFRLMVEKLRATEGNSPDTIVEDASKEFGTDVVESVLGNGIKKMAAAEAPFYSTTNRSVIARVDLNPGENLTRDTVALLRSEQQRSPGLPPHFLPILMGRKLTQRVAAGSGITLDHLL